MSQPEPAPAEDSIMARYYRIPVVTRGVSTLSVFFWLISTILLPSLSLSMMICPGAVLHLQLWRLFTAPFTSQGLLGTLIGILVFGQIGAPFEREMGSIAMAFLFFLFNFVASLLFTAVAILGAPLVPAAGLLSPMNCAAGLWIIYMPFLVVRCERSLQPSQSFCGLFNVPTKIYPWFLVGLFALMGAPVLDNVCGVVAGYLYFYGYLHFATPTQDRFQAWEASSALAWLAAAPGFVTWTGALNQPAQALPEEQ